MVNIKKKLDSINGVKNTVFRSSGDLEVYLFKMDEDVKRKVIHSINWSCGLECFTNIHFFDVSSFT